MNLSALVITFLACALFSMTEGQVQLRCQCTNKWQKEISVHKIVKIERFLPGPHCKNTEIIATVKFRKEIKLCLNPNHKWVQEILKGRNQHS
ncbi:interleukin-8-like [Clarias gariepinus]|uniref:interleukin-8-like n=1 Tax=Clarias gariepinus TaxID=13013 RepID=UPI00234C5C25|nr:interleukin-8-like [Clarias gariepinus]